VAVIKFEDRKKIILFVDDEPHFLDSMQRMLRKRGDEWSLHFAESVDEALELTWQYQFDVIVSDVNMPIKSGFDLLAALQENEITRNVPVIILTGNTEQNLKRKALEAGATDLLSKPVYYEDLVARIASVIRLKLYQDEIANQNIILENKVKIRTAELEFLHHDIIWRLAKAGEMRDEATGNHVVRVAHCSRIIAEKCHLPEEEVGWIFLTAPLHDLGKIGIPDGILLKAGKLTAAEWDIMKTHSEIGSSILLEPPKGLENSFYSASLEQNEMSGPVISPMREIAASIALNHHEKWDGGGYPNGLAGEDIPLAGRIVVIADVYDALRSARPYKKPLNREQAFEIILEGRGSHFDPNLVDVFQKCIDEFAAVFTKYW